MKITSSFYKIILSQIFFPVIVRLCVFGDWW